MKGSAHKFSGGGYSCLYRMTKNFLTTKRAKDTKVSGISCLKPRGLRTTIRDNFRGLRKFLGIRTSSDSDMPRAKRAKDAKFGDIYFLFFATFAFFARDIPNFGCGSAALGPSW